MKRAMVVVGWCMVVLVMTTLSIQGQETGKSPVIRVQVAILLDNSGSMSGLIGQAKAELWSFVNELGTTGRDGHVPQVETALYTYGEAPGRILLVLSGDLDMVRKKLFEITVTGGPERCGQAGRTTTDDLAREQNPDGLNVGTSTAGGTETRSWPREAS